MLALLDKWWFGLVDDIKCVRDSYREFKGIDSSDYPIGRSVAATMYQALGTVDRSAMPEGEWERCMDWLSEVNQGIPVGDLLPVISHNYRALDKYTLPGRGEVYTIKILDTDSTPIPRAGSEILLDGNSVVVSEIVRNHVSMAPNYSTYSMLIKRTKKS